jgi:hypothetical protein
MTQFPLRLPDHIMEQARTAAVEDSVSINQLLLSFIAEGIGHRKGLKAMRQRALRADPEKALSTLRNLSSLPPEPGDEMPEDQADVGQSPAASG